MFPNRIPYPARQLIMNDCRMPRAQTCEGHLSLYNVLIEDQNNIMLAEWLLIGAEYTRRIHIRTCQWILTRIHIPRALGLYLSEKINRFLSKYIIKV